MSTQYGLRPQMHAAQVPPVNLAHLRLAHPGQQGQESITDSHAAIPSTPGRVAPVETVGHTVPSTPGRNGTSSAMANFHSQSAGQPRRVPPGVGGFSGGRIATQAAMVQDPAQHGMPLRSARERMPSPEAPGSLRLMAGGGGQPMGSTGALLGPVAMAIAASTPILGRGSFGKPTATSGGSACSVTGPQSARTYTSSTANNSEGAPRSSLLNGSALNQLISKIQCSVQDREQELRRHMAEQKETEELLARSKEELQQLVSVFSELRELHQSASEVLPELPLGPERPRIRAKLPFFLAAFAGVRQGVRSFRRVQRTRHEDWRLRGSRLGDPCGWCLAAVARRHLPLDPPNRA